LSTYNILRRKFAALSKNSPPTARRRCRSLYYKKRLGCGGRH